MHYIKFNISKFDYNTWQRSDLQSQFCQTTKHRISNMGTKLYNNWQSHLKVSKNIHHFYKGKKIIFNAAYLQFCREISVL